MPESLRERLRRLDVDSVVSAVERALTGNSEAARVAAVRLLSDIEVYKADSKEEWEKERNEKVAVAAEQFERELLEQAERSEEWRRKRSARPSG